MIAAAVALIIGVAASTATACTRILWNDNSVAVLASRSMDWWGSSQPKLHVVPRGVRKSGAMFGSQKVVTGNPARWTSRYGSVVVGNYDSAVSDGMNEKGLAAHGLWLYAQDYGPRDISRQGIQVGMWVQYVLDNAATVDQAIALLPRIQPVQVMMDGHTIRLSLSIEDRSGDSAVIEYINGVPVIHHGRQYRVTTNTVLDDALALLAPYDFSNATRNLTIPGNTNTRDRFVRASFYSAFLSKVTPRNRLEAQAALMSVARNVSDPIGAPGDEVGETDETDFRTVADLTHGVYIFELSRGLATLRTDLRRLDFRRGTGVRTVNPVNPRLQGDITRLYRPGATPAPGVVSR
jgi:penicillin V acylase-like amidase (Ntn superfamily)